MANPFCFEPTPHRVLAAGRAWTGTCACDALGIQHLGRWLDANGWEAGEGMPATTMPELAQRWWGGRLDPGWRPRPVDESQAILDVVGLTGEFWRLA